MITKIAVENFKCFEKEELELSYLNLFSGVNSMGKSTMIQALLLLRQAQEQNALGKGIYLNGKYTGIGVGRDLLFTNAQENYIRISLESEAGICKKIYRYEGEADFLQEIFGEKSGMSGLNLFDEGFTYIAADRLGPQSSYQKSHYEVWEQRQLGNHGEYAVHYLREHEMDNVDNEQVLYEGEPNHRISRQVERWMSEITPGVAFRTEDYGHGNMVGLTVHQRGTAGAEYFSAQNVGFGISYVLPVILALVKAKAGELLILENPEAHLHPKGQRKMGELIARAAQGNVQIIVETHSDHVLNGIRLCAKRNILEPERVRLFYFDRWEKENGSESVVVPVVQKPILQKDGRLSFWPAGFFDEWDKAIDEMY
jgi:predicted ATPase